MLVVAGAAGRLQQDGAEVVRELGVGQVQGRVAVGVVALHPDGAKVAVAGDQVGGAVATDGIDGGRRGNRNGQIEQAALGVDRAAEGAAVNLEGAAIEVEGAGGGERGAERPW